MSIARRLTADCPKRDGGLHCWHPVSTDAPITYHGPDRREVHDICCHCGEIWREITAVYDFHFHEHGPHAPSRRPAA